ncbi:type II toxin-antitoxin system RelE/ParE family toxin [Enterobacter sp. MF024]|nr:type II toxin-antitoxin system RelE/ParE family toxin [Enterobacter sp. MF024]
MRTKVVVVAFYWIFQSKSPVIQKLRERLQNPRVPASQLHGRKDQYKIKLRGAGYRLVYRVEDEIITVTVVGVGKRENDDVYKMTQQRN